MPDSPALTLDTLAPKREFVVIKTKENRRGHRFEVKRPADMSLTDQAQLARMEAELRELQPHVDEYLTDGDMADPSDEVARFEQVISAFIAIAFDGITTEVLGQLLLPHKLALMSVFTRASPAENRTARRQAKKTGGKGGGSRQASKSRASNGSTAATRKRGSRSRPAS